MRSANGDPIVQMCATVRKLCATLPSGVLHVTIRDWVDRIAIRTSTNVFKRHQCAAQAEYATTLTAHTSAPAKTGTNGTIPIVTVSSISE